MTYGPSVADAPSYYAPGVALGAYLQGEDLGGIQPGDGEPGCSEAGAEDEGESCGCGTVLGCFVFVDDCSAREAA